VRTASFLQRRTAAPGLSPLAYNSLLLSGIGHPSPDR